KDAKKMAYIIRKWLMATAACVLGKRANDVALGIISDRAGIGKTTFFEELIPLSLRKYTGTVIKNNNNTLPVQYFSNKILLNFDELSAITANTENQFKQLMSS
ncbi:VapE domain-containing protein, partial [Ralstonia pseudosolanacearum]|uniref:VapE domain-containing protein n=1 Tax=Ralstonia pseudosolanacearum TaxID=1310165 RepID=UPI003D178FDC